MHSQLLFSLVKNDSFQETDALLLSNIQTMDFLQKHPSALLQDLKKVQ